MESKEQKLALNDIYGWFQNKSLYFNSNTATWKVKTRPKGLLDPEEVKVDLVKKLIEMID